MTLEEVRHSDKYHDNYSFDLKYEDGGETVILKDDELKAYLKKIKTKYELT